MTKTQNKASNKNCRRRGWQGREQRPVTTPEGHETKKAVYTMQSDTLDCPMQTGSADEVATLRAAFTSLHEMQSFTRRSLCESDFVVLCRVRITVAGVEQGMPAVRVECACYGQ